MGGVAFPIVGKTQAVGHAARLVTLGRIGFTEWVGVLRLRWRWRARFAQDDTSETKSNTTARTKSIQQQKQNPIQQQKQNPIQQQKQNPIQQQKQRATLSAALIGNLLLNSLLNSAALGRTLPGPSAGSTTDRSGT
jgi:hypothetical protein